MNLKYNNCINNQLIKVIEDHEFTLLIKIEMFLLFTYES